MAQIQTKSFLTADAYLAFERGSEVRHEFVGGEAVAMTGGSWDHSLVIGNLLAELKVRLRGGTCAVHASDLRVLTPAGSYMYPDLVVVCGEPRFEDGHRDTVLNPRLLVEVLSPSTESYDRGRKFESYRGLDSLLEYLLVFQNRPRVERFQRQENGFWLNSEVAGRNGVMPLALGCELALAAVYEGVALQE
jgi:Uma2 family endonuclease